MSCFKLPKGLVRELEGMIRKFWWGYKGEHQKTHWVKWEQLCEVKEVGGMGFKEIEKFNDALFAKQVWRMINNSESLCHQVFKARFFLDCSILDAKESKSGSYTWKRIIGARDVICKGMVWRIRIDSLHAVWYCEAISGVWSTLDWFHQTAPPHPTSVTELLSSFLCNKEEFRAEIFVIMVWLLWNRCNAVQFGHPPLPVASICSSAGDSAVIINALLHGAGELASFGNILDDICLHSSVFQFVDFVHVIRNCNLVADALVKKAKSNVGAQFKIGAAVRKKSRVNDEIRDF
ncbi:uncharacterized protein LOC115980704 [Quercus lobata]|uniref:uncharacterized protein LOC115980704 n=1 Tax=Quercus lobata TaxID=97700 RepID=UPI001243A4D4|nr:uncharacterized protein LOC115980704 [Quercus lobata]